MSFRKSSIIRFMGIAVFIFSILSLSINFAVAKVEPTLMRLTSDGVTVMWEYLPYDYCRVEYDTDPHFSNPTVINYPDPPPEPPPDPDPPLPGPEPPPDFPEDTEDIPPSVFKVRLAQLQPNTTYYYKVFSNLTGECYNKEDVIDGSNKFTTGPTAESKKPFSFCVYGDTRIISCFASSFGNECYGTERSIKAVRDFINKQSPDFVVHLGDFEFTGRRHSIVRRFFDWHRPLWKRSPLLPTYGNHEFMRAPGSYTCECYGFYLDFNFYTGWQMTATVVDEYFDIPAYYATEYGNVLIVTLFVPYHTDGAVKAATDSRQVDWLRKTLKNAKERREKGELDHIFICFHSPVVADSAAKLGKKTYEYYHGMFMYYGVTAVFQACKHNFQHVQHDNINYFVSGGGGAPVSINHKFKDPNHGQYVNKFSGLNFIKVKIKGKEASYDVYQVYQEGAWLIGSHEYKCRWEYSGDFYDFTPGPLPVRPAEMINPEPGSTLSGSTVTFEWNYSGVQEHGLWIGNNPRSYDIFKEDHLTSAPSAYVTGLPTDGRTLHVTLRSKIRGDWKERYYTYNAYLPTVDLRSPNGGESWESETIQPIVWLAPPHYSGKVIIDLLKNGVFFGNIADNVPAQQQNYKWVVGQTKSGLAPAGNNYKIKITLSETRCDQSKSNFSILPKPADTITVDYPEGGEIFDIKDSIPIEWTTTGTGDWKVRVYLTRPYETIDTVGDFPRDKGLVYYKINQEKVMREGRGYPYAITIRKTTYPEVKENYKIRDSSEKFSIFGEPTPTLTLTSPNGEETWAAGSTQNITWTSLGMDNVKIEYSTDNGKTYIPIKTVSSTAVDNTYQWKVPDITSLLTCLVRISDTDGDTMDVSNRVFSITQYPIHNISTYATAADGGLSYGHRDYLTAWKTASSRGVNAAHTHYLIGQYEDGREVSGKPKLEYRIYRAYLYFDTSSIPGYAQITSASLSLWGALKKTRAGHFNIVVQNGQPAYPHLPLQTSDYNKNYYSGNGGSILTSAFQPLRYNNIRLNAAGKGWINKAGMTKLCLRSSHDIDKVAPPLDRGDFVTVCSANETEPGECRPKLTLTYTFTTDTPDILTLTSPNGGETWTGGSTQNITWTSEGTVGNVKIEYSTDNGKTYTPIVSSTANNGTHQWKVPNIASSICLVRISDTDGDPSDVSDGVFSIKPQSQTITIYSDPADGVLSYAYKYVYTWNRPTAAVCSTTDEKTWFGQYESANINRLRYGINRAFFFFDTSSIPDNAVITSATLSLYGYRKFVQCGAFYIQIQNGQPNYPHYPLKLSDYNRLLYSGNGGSLHTSAFGVGRYNDIKLNATGLAWINKLGLTKFCVRNSREIAGIKPDDNKKDFVSVYFANETEPGEYRPKLTITYYNTVKE